MGYVVLSLSSIWGRSFARQLLEPLTFTAGFFQLVALYKPTLFFIFRFTYFAAAFPIPRWRSVRNVARNAEIRFVLDHRFFHPLGRH